MRLLRGEKTDERFEDVVILSIVPMSGGKSLKKR